MPTWLGRRSADEVLGQPKIVLRIGINLGNVIIEGDDVYGDGVNIARGRHLRFLDRQRKHRQSNRRPFPKRRRHYRQGYQPADPNLEMAPSRQTVSEKIVRCDTLRSREGF